MKGISMKIKIIRTAFFIFISVLALSYTLNSSYANSGTTELDKAIGYLKTIDPNKVNSDNQAEIREKIEKSWQTIKSYGDRGILRLKDEVNSESNNDYFKLNACALIWTVKGLEEAHFIGKTWEHVDLTANYNYVFYPAFGAAGKNDTRAFPMLIAILRDKKGQVFIPQHSMKVAWPLTHEFIWGQVGSNAIPIIDDLIRRVRDISSLESLILLAGNYQSIGALDQIRKHVLSSEQAIRNTAIRVL